ncbi:effector-associated constant component EACC1 [Yinghuangia seranimata]|uniref:effector-associated constant component EACC1 n=1 Tax=Yinghuangia seranimata TaxID=408067 RepID=UPI00248B3323|nr:hypothetical protein [Yinghuangia seranimata]MDI2126035.1 hypothetical protein [Yinghuangia seranimata]
MQVRLVSEDLGDDYFFLRRQLDDLDHDGITDLEGGAAPGTRGGAVEAVVIALVGSPALVALVTMVQDWLARRHSGTIVLELGGDRLELSGRRTALDEVALAAFLARHPE